MKRIAKIIMLMAVVAFVGTKACAQVSVGVGISGKYCPSCPSGLCTAGLPR